MNAQLVLDRHAANIVTLAETAVLADQHLGHDEQRNPSRALRRAVDACQHQVNDVRGEIVIAVSDEDLLPANPEMIVLRRRASADGGKIGAGLRFGEVHGSGPFAADHFRQVAAFLSWRAAAIDGFNRTLRQHRTQFECEIGRCPEFFHHRPEHRGRALTAIFLGSAQLRPSAVDELRIGRLELLRHRHALGGPARTHGISKAVDGRQHFFGKPPGLFEHGIGEIDRIVGELSKPGKTLIADQLVEHEAKFSQGRVVHGLCQSLLGKRVASSL